MNVFTNVFVAVFFTLVLASCGSSATVTPTQTILTAVDGVALKVAVVAVIYQGDPARNESDEYVKVQNQEDLPVDLTGWALKNLNDPTKVFTFPGYVIQPGDSVRVYTNEVHPTTGGLSFGSDTPVWSNTEASTAVLYNQLGNEVSRHAY